MPEKRSLDARFHILMYVESWSGVNQYKLKNCPNSLRRFSCIFLTDKAFEDLFPGIFFLEKIFSREPFSGTFFLNIFSSRFSCRFFCVFLIDNPSERPFFRRPFFSGNVFSGDIFRGTFFFRDLFSADVFQRTFLRGFFLPCTVVNRHRTLNWIR